MTSASFTNSVARRWRSPNSSTDSTPDGTRSVVHADSEASVPPRMRSNGERASTIASVLAFCGIGRPEKFFRTLEGCGAAVTVRRIFPDHHGFSGPEIEGLVREAEGARLVLATTEKDAVRVQNDPALRAYSPGLVPVPVARLA